MNVDTTGLLRPQDRSRARDVIRVAIPINDCPLFAGQPETMTPRERRMAIVRMIAARHDVTAADILGSSRKRHIVEARWAAIVAVRYATGDKPTTLARFFNRDHTSILHALAKAGAMNNG